MRVGVIDNTVVHYGLFLHTRPLMPACVSISKCPSLGERQNSIELYIQSFGAWEQTLEHSLHQSFQIVEK